nr:unnamed protein product [Callosobruchus chinensis]
MVQLQKSHRLEPEEADITSPINGDEEHVRHDENSEVLIEIDSTPNSFEDIIPSDIKVLAVAVNDNEPLLLAENLADKIVPVNDSVRLVEGTGLTENHSALSDQSKACSSSSESVTSAEIAGTKKGEKRTKNCEKWKSNIRKTKKAAGEEYITAKQN